MRRIAATSCASLAFKVDIFRHPKIHCHHKLFAGSSFNSFAVGKIKPRVIKEAHLKLLFIVA
jgi:hypothetical protein